MSADAFGILLGNVIYAVYIGTLSDSADTCDDETGRKVRQGSSDGTVSTVCSIRVVCVVVNKCSHDHSIRVFWVLGIAGGTVLAGWSI